MSSEFERMFGDLMQIADRAFDSVENDDYREAQRNKRRLEELRDSFDRRRAVNTAEVLETDTSPFGIGMIETGLVRVADKYYYIEIQEEIFDNRRHARVWKSRPDGRRRGTYKKYRMGSVAQVLRALAAEYS